MKYPNVGGTLSSTPSTFANLGAGAFPAKSAFDSSGNLFVIDTLLNKLYKFTATGDILSSTPTVFGTAGMNFPRALAIDGNDNVYTGNQSDTNIYRYTSGGTPSLFAVAPNGNIWGVAVDSAGNVYSSSASSTVIKKFNSSGTAQPNFASTGLNTPRDIAFHSDCNLYAANFGNNTIEKYTSAGTASVFASGGPLSNPQVVAFAVPEPATLGLIGIGAMALLARQRA